MKAYRGWGSSRGLQGRHSRWVNEGWLGSWSPQTVLPGLALQAWTSFHVGHPANISLLQWSQAQVWESAEPVRFLVSGPGIGRLSFITGKELTIPTGLEECRCRAEVRLSSPAFPQRRFQRSSWGRGGDLSQASGYRDLTWRQCVCLVEGGLSYPASFPLLAPYPRQ